MIAVLRFVLSARFLSGLVIAAALGGIYGQVTYWRGHSAGYQLGEQVTKAKYEAAAAEERTRQAEANETAAAQQRQRFANLIALLQQKNDLIEDLSDERESDPDAYRLGISGASMRRINRF
jgi:hypothetical protein